jgi:contractile injection system tube protein
MPTDANGIEKGYLVKSEEEQDQNKRILLHFNPTSLTYTVEAAEKQQDKPNRTGQTQHVAQYSAKLSFDALFDNTDTGEDIRVTTSKIAVLLQPAPAADATKDSGKSAPSKLIFQWGSFRFSGVLIQYKETIDFFAKEGIPLRSTVSLTLVEQEKPVPIEAHGPKSNTAGSLVPTGASDSALSAATRGGNPAAARALATANGLESLRFTGGATLQVGGSGGVQASAGLVASGGINASASWNSSGSGSLFGGQTSAGVSVSSGAFAGISASGGASISAGASLNASSMQVGGSTSDVAAHSGASFSLGGEAQMGVGVGLSADVGAKANWKDLLRFDEG